MQIEIKLDQECCLWLINEQHQILAKWRAAEKAKPPSMRGGGGVVTKIVEVLL